MDAPDPRPLGVLLVRRLTAATVAAQSAPSGSSSRTGSIVVNQPTVRDRSTSSNSSSSGNIDRSQRSGLGHFEPA